MTNTDDYSVRQKMTSDVIDETPHTYLVRYPDGQVDSVSKTSTDGILCGVDDIDPHRPIVARGQALLEDKYVDEYGATGVSIAFEIDFSSGVGEIVVDGQDSIDVTGSDLVDLISLIVDQIESDEDVDQTGLTLGRSDADRLFDIYEEHISGRVRDDVIDTFATNYEAVVTDDGWLIEDTYHITYEAENYLVDEPETFEVSGGRVVDHDGEPEAVTLEFDAPPMATIAANGEEHTLSEPEQEFLATAEILTRPGTYLGVDSFEEEVYSAVRRAVHDVGHDHIRSVARRADVTRYVDPKTGLLHRHNVSKHTLTDNFKVKPWVIRDLEYNSWDHAGVAELSWRSNELRNASRDVFYDTDNDDDERWDQINQIERDAPCPNHVYQTLRGKYGGSGS